MQESDGDGLGLAVGQRDGFAPSSEPIYTGEEKRCTLDGERGQTRSICTRWKRASGASTVPMFALAMQLGGLAWDAAPRPLANILLQAIPSNPFHDKWNGGVGAWMN